MQTATVHPSPIRRPPPPPAKRSAPRRAGLDATFLATIMDGPGRNPGGALRLRTPLAFADTIRPEAGTERRGDARASLCSHLAALKIVPAGPPRPLPRVPTPPALALAEAQAPRPPAVAHEPALIGQEAAIRGLDAAMERARDGGGAALLLRGGGEATARELARLAVRRLRSADREVVTLTGAGLEQSGVPFQLVAAIVGQLAEHLAGLAAEVRAVALAGGAASLARFFPSMEPFARTYPGVALPVLTAGCRRRAVAELRAILSFMATLSSVAVVLDDVHHCDRDSADFLSAALDRPIAGVTVLATLRAGAEELAAMPRAFARFTVVPIAALPHEEAVLYARRRLRAHESSSLALAASIAAASGRRPVLIDLLARLLARRPAAESQALAATPASLDRLLEPIVAALPEIDRRVLELVAVDNAPIFDELLDRAVGQRSSYALERLCQAGLLAYSDDRASVRVPHALLREAIARQIPEDRRPSHHRALADAHRRCARGDMARAAYHCLGVDAWHEAGELASEAAKQAKNASAYGLAAELCELALCTDRRSPALRLRLADVEAAGGRFEAAANNRLRVALAAEGGRRLELAAIACEHLFLAGRRDRGRRTAAMILAELAADVAGDDARRRAVMLAELATLAAHSLEFREQSRCELSSELLRHLEISLRMARLLVIDDPLRAGILAMRGAQVALVAGEARSVAVALALAGAIGAEHDPALADRLLGRANAIARRLHDPRLEALVALCRGLAARTEDGARAQGFFDECVTIAGELGEDARWEQILALSARAQARAA